MISDGSNSCFASPFPTFLLMEAIYTHTEMSSQALSQIKPEGCHLSNFQHSDMNGDL